MDPQRVEVGGIEKVARMDRHQHVHRFPNQMQLRVVGGHQGIDGLDLVVQQEDETFEEGGVDGANLGRGDRDRGQRSGRIGGGRGDVLFLLSSRHRGAFLPAREENSDALLRDDQRDESNGSVSHTQDLCVDQFRFPDERSQGRKERKRGDKQRQGSKIPL